MASQRVKRSEACSHEDCGSRRFYVGDDGFTYCDQGHRQSDRGTIVADDTGEPVITGRKQRRVDSDAESAATSRSGLSAPQAFEHYLLCLQLVLRKQLKWLIDVQKLPTELEELVRDLWALRLQKLQDRVFDDSGMEDEPRSQLFSSQSEGETGTETEGDMSQTSRSSRGRKRRSISGNNMRIRHRNRHFLDASLRILDTTALCYIGILLLRIPVSVGDLSNWINDGKLLYHQASRHVPPMLRGRLPARFQRLLDPDSLLKAEDLHHSVRETAMYFHEDHGMVVPAINHPLLLYRWVKEMALPIEVFTATQRLGRLLGYDYSFVLDEKDQRQGMLRWPEVRLMALMVVATKLLFPFDDIERYARSPNDLSALAMDWQDWLNKLSGSAKSGTSESESESRRQQQQLQFRSLFNATEADCLAMNNADLDTYLDWYQQYFTSEDVREHGRAGGDADFRHTMMRLFPTQGNMDRDEQSKEDSHTTAQESNRSGDDLRHAQSRLKPRRTAQELIGTELLNDIRGVGSFYQRIRRVRELDVDHPAVGRLYGLAAERAGVSLERMVRAVFLVEKRIEKRETSQRTAAR